MHPTVHASEPVDLPRISQLVLPRSPRSAKRIVWCILVRWLLVALRTSAVVLTQLNGCSNALRKSWCDPQPLSAHPIPGPEPDQNVRIDATNLVGPVTADPRAVRQLKDPVAIGED